MSLWVQYVHTHTVHNYEYDVYGVNWKVNSHMHLYILSCMKSIWLVRYEHMLSKGVYVKGFLTYVHTHECMNE